MSAETEQVLQKARTVRNVGGKGKLTQKAQRYLGPEDRERLKDDLEHIDSILSPVNIGARALSAGGRRQLARQKAYIENQLETYSPPDNLSDETKLTLDHEIKRVEEKIKLGMPAVEIMRRNPPGAVDTHQKWEQANKDMILYWKNLKRLRHPDDGSKDLCNVEMLRPSMLSGPGSTFMADAQIPGHFAVAVTEEARRNFDTTFPDSPSIDTPLKQLERQELEAKIKDLESQLTHKTEVKRKRANQAAKMREAKQRKQEAQAAQGPAE